MDKTHIAKQFAQRLHDAMIAAGFNSQRSTSGVSIHKLEEITGYSAQICRKYLRGEAIPEPTKLIEIAQKLNVSPGWLLFGEANNDYGLIEDKISISKNVMHYIITQSACLYKENSKAEDIANFILELISDIGLINANEVQSKKIIDLALSSAKHFG